MSFDLGVWYPQQRIPKEEAELYVCLYDGDTSGVVSHPAVDVKELARKHCLMLFDPQSEEVIYPNDCTGAAAGASRLHFWILGVFALLYAATFGMPRMIAAVLTRS